MYRGAGAPRLNIKYESRTFCVISCKRWLRMRKIAFQRFQISKIFRGRRPDPRFNSCIFGTNRICDFQFINKQLRQQYTVEKYQVEISHNNSISCCSCCDQGHNNANITQLCYLNSESREETDQKVFVAKTNIYSFRQLCLEQTVQFSNAWCDINF